MPRGDQSCLFAPRDVRSDVVYLAITPGRQDMLICCLDRERSRMYTEPERPLKMYTVHEGGVRQCQRGETRLSVTVKLLICKNKIRMPALRDKNSLLYHYLFIYFFHLDIKKNVLLLHFLISFACIKRCEMR